MRWAAQKSLFQVPTILQKCAAALKMLSTLVRLRARPIFTSLCQLICAVVGLFAPRAGQNFRDEQRRRRSQYDRGTRLAEIEDNYRFIHKFVAPQPGHVHHISPHAHRFRYAGQHTY